MTNRPDYGVLLGLKVCPRAELHSPDIPAGPDWEPTVLAKQKTHRLTKCPGCNLYKRWEPKEPA